jgi:RNA polymerase sigma-70 factor (ECF subfamily)
VSLRFDRALRGRADPSDVVQEAQLEAFRRLASYLDEPVIPFRLWLRRIAHDRLIMLRRRHLGALRRTVRRELPLPERSSVLLAQNLVAEDKSPSKQVSQRELAEQVRTAMGELPDSDLEILLMRTFEAMPFEEIGYVLNIKPATARKRHGRALVRLHHSLVALGISGSMS